MRLFQLFETAKENSNRLTEIKERERLDNKKRMLSCIINVNPSEMKQEIYGFGGAITESSAYVLSSLNETKKDEILTKYYKEMKYNLARTHINSCDFSLSNWSISDRDGDFDTTRSDKYLLPILKAADRKAGGLKLMLTPWSPPAYMKTNGDMNHGGKLKKEYYKAWAELYVKYLSHLRDNNLKIWACSVQNETEAVQVWDSCLYTAEEETEFVDGYLYDELVKNGFDGLKILVWDHNRDGLYRRLKGSLSSSKGHITGAAYHWYSGAQYDNIVRCRREFPDMDLIFTEGCIEGGARKGAWFPGERYGHNIINDLNSGCNAWIDWNIVLDDEGGPNHVGNFCDAPVLVSDDREITYQSSFYYIGHFSRFISPKARIIGTRIDSWMTPATVDGRIENYMEATAAVNSDGSIVVVVMNRTEDDMLFTLNISQIAKKAVGYTSNDAGEDNKTYLCPPRAIQTYVFK